MRTFDRSGMMDALKRAAGDDAHLQNEVRCLALGDASIGSFYGMAVQLGVVTGRQYDNARRAYGDRWNRVG